MKSHILCSIEQIQEITGNENGKIGTLTLIQTADTYDLSWNPIQSPVNSIFQEIEETAPNKWLPGEPFRFSIAQINSISLNDPLKITINCPKPRVFEVPKSEFISLTQFYEQILYRGIAVISPNSKYTIEPYKSASGKIFKFEPPHIHLEFHPFISLENFWKDVEDFYWQLLLYLDQNSGLPSDSSFPISQAARAMHLSSRKGLEEFYSTLPNFSNITKDNFSSLFDDDGVLINPAEFEQRVYLGNVDPEAIGDVIPFAFGLYSLDSTSNERERLNEDLAKQFELLKVQTENVTQYQIEHNKRLAAAYRVIPQDVDRTDRLHPAFKKADGPGLTMLTLLLKVFSNYNPVISYIQGMNDLFVPIMLAYITDWNDDGLPVDSEGQPLLDYEKHLPLIFWLFDSLILHIHHTSLIVNLTDECQKQAACAHKILTRASPLAAAWMVRENCHELLWMYSDFLLLFKRTYDDVWPIWLVLTMSPDPKHWLTYFIAAMVFETFDDLAQIKDTSLTAMMAEYPKILQKHKVEDFGKTALWLYKNYRIDFDDGPDPQPIKPEFEFFAIK